MNHHKLFALCLLLPFWGIAQNNNGQLDMLEEFSSMKTVGVPMAKAKSKLRRRLQWSNLC